MTEETNDCLEK